MGINVGARRGISAAINITPLVDVVLVLLIIFMVVVPAVQRQIPVEVPPEVPGAVPTEDPVTVAVQGDLSVVISDRDTRTEVAGVQLATTLQPFLARPGASSTVFVDVADQVAWADAVGVMDTIRGVGGAYRPVTVALRLGRVP